MEGWVSGWGGGSRRILVEVGEGMGVGDECVRVGEGQGVGDGVWEGGGKGCAWG